MTVEKLNISVMTNADKAAVKLNTLSKALDGVQASAVRVSSSSGIANVGKQVEKANKPINTFIASLKRIAMYRVMRGIIKSITSAFQEGLQNAYAFSQGIVTEGHRFSEALDSLSSSGLKMKNQLGSAFIGLLSALAPIINQIISLVVKLADILSQFFAAFTGSTYLKAKNVFKSFADTAGAGAKATKEWRNQLLGFDELNRLNEPNQGGGGGGSSALDPSQMFEDTPLSDWAKKIHDNLALIEAAASGLALGLGLILLFTGANIPLGLGLIALGAAGLAHALQENWGTVDAQLAATIHNLMFVAGTSLLAIGAILAFSGANIPLGLGLMAAGAAGLVTAAVIRWGYVDTSVGASLTNIARMGSLFTFAVGAILALSGVATPLGLAMMGASIVGYSTTLNWDGILDSIKKTWQKITDFYNQHIKKYFTKEYWQGEVDKMFDIDISGVKLPHFSVSWEDAGPIASFFGFSAIPHIAVDWFANGGFPDVGSLFISGEQGPELVGTMGGRNAVANQQEITEGIREGVYDAVTSAMSDGNLAVKVYLDSREIKAGQQRLNRAWGV